MKHLFYLSLSDEAWENQAFFIVGKSLGCLFFANNTVRWYQFPERVFDRTFAKIPNNFYAVLVK